MAISTDDVQKELERLTAEIRDAEERNKLEALQAHPMHTSDGSAIGITTTSGSGGTITTAHDAVFQNPLSLNTLDPAVWHMSTPGGQTTTTPRREPLTIYPLDSGYAVYPAGLVDSRVDGSHWGVATILDQIKFFPTFEAATAYAVVTWAGMSPDADADADADEAAPLTASATYGMLWLKR